MNRRALLWGASAAVAAAGGAWLASLPPAPTPRAAPPIDEEEAEAAIAALRPRRPRRPLMAVVGINDATETLDYLMPNGILRRSGVADVVALATTAGPITLFPVLKVEPDATVSAFDAQHPEGADYVIVPAMSRDDDPIVIDWVRRQAGKGAIVVGVCAGAKVVASAGLLDGRRATTHWYYVNELRRKHPQVRYVADRRVVVDGGVATTTGITASMPASLMLIEAVAGRARAEAVARELGLLRWDARHASDEFQLSRPFALTVAGNVLVFWQRERLGVEVTPGIDEVSLALVADAWSRTYRSRAVAFSRVAGAQQTRNGMRILPDVVAASWPADRRASATDREPARALDEALHAIAARYGRRTADVVAMQLEYPSRLASTREVGGGVHAAAHT